MSNTISFIVRCCLAILFCCFSWTDVIAQGKTQVEIDNADTFEGDESLGKMFPDSLEMYDSDIRVH
ncbi:MAG: hypothetical protein IPK08_01855 [Bacteroidetes bacterium]|nr:hypothetical protein [Bacteroidota bacterium]